uniref:TSA: Wollemia nobilis Ref_Wollemi_Transcript_25648_3389 transcribed RNA sequence n=1 Tax=Wollemia nobilis TaxID=56998 RepID=A0A0C9S493_9CONI
MSMKNVDPAFQGVGQKVGMDIWRIDNSHPVAIPKSEHAKFYSKDSYIVLQTRAAKSGARHYDIHFWIGKDTSEDESRTASIKAIELDLALGGRAVQYREVQGYESDKFLSFFKPCFIPLEGSMVAEDEKIDTAKFEPRLYICKGRRVVRVKQVPFSRSSLNHDDVFILDTESKIYQFNGATSNIQEQAKALDVVQYIKDKYHEGKCEIAVIEDGKLVAEADSGEFWALFGGFAPIGKKSNSEDDLQLEPTPGKLYIVMDGQLKALDGPLSKSVLESNKCYVLDCGSEVHIWVGRATQLEERKAASLVAEEFVYSQKTAKCIHIIRVIQGFETITFKADFKSWPVGSGASGSEDGKGKVASLIKKQGVNGKGILKAPLGKDEILPLLEEGGKLEVWHVNNNSRTPVPKEDIGKFYSEDCYITLYTYHTEDRREDYFLCLWLGQQSTEEDRTTAARLTNSMANSLKGRPVQGHIVQGKEPPQFISLFANMVILNGRMNVCNTKENQEKGSTDETNNGDCVMLLQICGTAHHNTKAIQVDPVAASLDSTCCFLLQSGTSLFTWHGNATTIEQQKSAARFADFLKPGTTSKAVKEGTEPAAFWNALGGRQSYISQKGSQETSEDPHLYACEFEKGTLKFSEVFNFSQDDLLTEDIMVLDTRNEVFAWVGQHVDAKLKQQSFEIGQKYMERATLFEGLSQDAPLYKVTEGNESSFFTRYFAWDSAKAAVQGNSFEKKLSVLQGKPVQTVEVQKLKNRMFDVTTESNGSANNISNNSNGFKKGGSTQRSASLAALSAAFASTNDKKDLNKVTISSFKPQRSAVAGVLSSNSSVEPESISALSQSAPPVEVEDEKASITVSAKVETNISENAEIELSKQAESGTENGTKVDESVRESNGQEILKDDEKKREEDEFSSTYSYERLKSKSTNPAPGIDPRKRESYLTPEEFQNIFKMDQKTFYEQPKWKQQGQKKAVDLF